MNIRPATTADIPAIQLLYQQLDQHHVAIQPDVFQPIDANARPDTLLKQWIDNPNTAYLLAEIDNAIVGFVALRQGSPPPYPMFRPRDLALIEDLVVDTAHRDKGIGAALFSAALEWARNRGLQFVQTSVYAANATARDFDLRHGFEPVTEKLELDLQKPGP